MVSVAFMQAMIVLTLMIALKQLSPCSHAAAPKEGKGVISGKEPEDEDHDRVLAELEKGTDGKAKLEGVARLAEQAQPKGSTLDSAGVHTPVSPTQTSCCCSEAAFFGPSPQPSEQAQPKGSTLDTAGVHTPVSATSLLQATSVRPCCMLSPFLWPFITLQTSLQRRHRPRAAAGLRDAQVRVHGYGSFPTYTGILSDSADAHYLPR